MREKWYIKGEKVIAQTYCLTVQKIAAISDVYINLNVHFRSFFLQRIHAILASKILLQHRLFVLAFGRIMR